MNDQRESIRQLLRSLLAGLVLATAAGCGSVDAGGESPDLPEATPNVSMHEPEDVGIGETDSLGQTLCGKFDLGIDPEGMRMVELERYSFERINRRFAEFPEIAEFVGFDQVSDCEGARAAVQGYNDYVEANPDFTGGPTKEEMLDELLSDPTNVGAPASDEEIEKILSGTLSNKSGVVQLVRYISADQGYFCSAVRIGGPLFLTAAHCLKDPLYDGVQQARYLIKRRKTSGAEGWFGGAKGKWLNAYAYSHPKYLGGSDRDYDVAIVYFLPDHHALLASEPEFNTTRLIATRTPSVGQLQELYGWGATNTTETALQFRQRWPGYLIPIGTSTIHHFAIMADGPTLSVCLGDSGGPAIRDGMVTGILADVGPPLTSSNRCALPGNQQYWGRLDYKFTWLHEALFTVQKGQRHPYHCKFHPGNPSNPNDWEHIVSYMNCNERL